jgi:hypothetical protein
MLRAIRGSGSAANEINEFLLPVSGIRPMLGNIVERMRERAKNAPPREWSISKRPFELALAVLNVHSALEHSPRTRSADDVAEILECHLKDFLPHDWRRRGRNKATEHGETPREPKDEFQRRIEALMTKRSTGDGAG